MKKSKILVIIGALLVLATGCKDDELKPIITFDDAGKGAYVALLSESERFINLFDIAGSNYTYSVEFIDLEQGNLIAEYNLDLVYDDNNPDNGDKSTGEIRIRSFGSGEFQTNENGFQGLTNITLPATDLIASAGTTQDEVKAGDNFNIIGSVVTVDGQVFRATNSSAAVNGAAFRGHLSFTLAAGCPSDLTGEYAYESSDIWCDGSAPTGTVTVKTISSGTYAFSDWSFGGYGQCYGSGSVADSESLTFSDVCSEVSFTGFVDSFGDTWTFDSEINGGDWRITWDNTYGESGSVIVKYPSGDWPVTLK